MEAELAENLERTQKGEQFKILDHADLPRKPHKPDIPKIIAVGFMLALACAFGLAYLREYLDPTFWSRKEVESMLNIPVLVAIPIIQTRKNPTGFQTQSQVAEIIAKYAEPLEIGVAVNNVRGTIQIGDYRFSSPQFQELINYVWRGGYPRWKNEIRPAYVSAMQDKILRAPKGIFEGIRFQ